jgi:hypothetical protein
MVEVDRQFDAWLIAVRAENVHLHDVPAQRQEAERRRIRAAVARERGQRPRHGSSPRAALEGRLGGGNANWTPAELATLAELTKDAPVTLETQDAIAAQLGTNRTGIAVYRRWLRITPKVDRSENSRVENPAHPRKPKAGASGGWASGGATDAKTKVCLPSTPACNIAAAG